MCRRTNCRTCGKPGYAGCGMHVDQVLAGVPKGDRCACDQSSGAKKGGGEGNGGAIAAARTARKGPGLFRLFRRG
ncbi:hypothetical protein OG455_01640 [Kitasatospora sp. NBC_01287]|uniref:hypothetical protein n=1 Tax=Kitasatospora sp. NBC_01287 TaxID=2903573 RepID=UPI00225057E3|nr:hypothetical protein [Kitasatospora sp. NBC_01287]MCX4744228.1 hypothetical protein [Kitasatospora sp. NBC_01287]